MNLREIENKPSLLSQAVSIYFDSFSSSHRKVRQLIMDYVDSFAIKKELVTNEKEMKFLNFSVLILTYYIKEQAIYAGTNFWELEYREFNSQVIQSYLNDLKTMSFLFDDFLKECRMDDCPKDVHENRINILKFAHVVIVGNKSTCDLLGVDFKILNKGINNIDCIRNMQIRIEGFIKGVDG